MTDKKRPDRRIERTRAALWGALFDLIHNHEWEEINVRQICEKADVARSSFYLHFQNKLELLDYGFEIELGGAQAFVLTKNTPPKTYASLAWLVDHLVTGGESFNKSAAANGVIFARFQQSVAALFVSELEFHNRSYSKADICFVIGGVFAYLRDWAKTKCVESPDVVCEKLNRFANKVLQQ